MEEGAYWIPERNSPLECPLLEILRAQEATAEVELGASPAEVEQAARGRLADLIRAHLAGYPEAAAEPPEAPPSPRTTAARGVVAYERRLLAGTLDVLEGAVVAAQ